MHAIQQFRHNACIFCTDLNKVFDVSEDFSTMWSDAGAGNEKLAWDFNTGLIKGLLSYIQKYKRAAVSKNRTGCRDKENVCVQHIIVTRGNEYRDVSRDVYLHSKKTRALETTVTSEKIVILRAKQETSRNLLIRADTHEAVRKSVVIPAQELKDVQQEISNLKTIQIEDLKVQRESRMNPDSTAGLAPSAEMRLQARRIAELK